MMSDQSFHGYWTGLIMKRFFSVLGDYLIDWISYDENVNERLVRWFGSSLKLSSTWEIRWSVLHIYFELVDDCRDQQGNYLPNNLGELMELLLSTKMIQKSCLLKDLHLHLVFQVTMNLKDLKDDLQRPSLTNWLVTLMTTPVNLRAFNVKN